MKHPCYTCDLRHTDNCPEHEDYVGFLPCCADLVAYEQAEEAKFESKRDEEIGKKS